MLIKDIFSGNALVGTPLEEQAIKSMNSLCESLFEYKESRPPEKKGDFGETFDYFRGLNEDDLKVLEEYTKTPAYRFLSSPASAFAGKKRKIFKKGTDMILSYRKYGFDSTTDHGKALMRDRYDVLQSIDESIFNNSSFGEFAQTVRNSALMIGTSINVIAHKKGFMNPKEAHLLSDSSENDALEL